jgi:hypothetical protein
VILPLIAVLLSAVCVVAAAWHAAKVSRLALPSSAELLTRIGAAVSADARPEERRIELEEAISDIDRQTRGNRDMPAALSRISLAGGTALALARLASNPDFAHLPGAGVAFGAGVVGAGCVAYFGRLASERSRKAREHWQALSRKVRRELEA